MAEHAEKTQSGPTLAAIGTFSFDEFVENPPNIDGLKAFECVLKQISKKLNERLNSNSPFKNLYILDGRTGSGKSTLFIAELFKMFNMKILVAEPRIVLTRNNTFDIIQRNALFTLGRNIGFKNSNENQSPSEEHAITFMTTQLLVNQLQTFYQFFQTITEKMFIIIDEAHLLDIQTLDLLREVKRFLEKYGNEELCPMFILQSATLRIKEVIRYYFPNSYSEFRKDWTCIGHIKGLSNFDVKERFIDNAAMRKLIEMETREHKSAPLIIASYYLKDRENVFREFFEGSGKRFVHLIFLPFVRGIIELGSVIRNTLADKQIPCHLINSGELMKDVHEWRKRNERKRLLIVPISRGFSQASDVMIDGNEHPHDENLESVLYVATNVIETGKTIKNLSYALDCGFDTVACFNPLMYDINDPIKVIRQVPESKAKAIQRLGRVGRECPGEFLHFMSQETYKELDDYEPPDTINTYCISKQLLDLSFVNLWKQFDYEASNVYMIKFTSDVLINSCADLMRAGFLSPFSEILDCSIVNYSQDYKFIYLARVLHYIKHYDIKDAIVTAAINEKSNNMYLCMDYRDYKFKRLEEFDENRLTADIVQALKKANNLLMRVKYDFGCITIKDLGVQK